MQHYFHNEFVFSDVFKTKWKLGEFIGKGGFGYIYSAKKVEPNNINLNHDGFAVKIEPKENGPLFSEIHFYLNCAKEDDLKKFAALEGLKHLAIPKYISCGICINNDKEYRFLVMDRYTTDLQSILNKSSTNQLNEIGVLCLMRQILDSLKYIHERGYAHGDIKGSNLMLKNDKEAFLIDYGLANRFMRDNKYQNFESMAERKHNGTIEYTSRDAHDGYQTYPRSDLEILGYCIVHWLSGTLPWIKFIKIREQVQHSKNKNLKNINDFINSSLGDKISDSIKAFVVFYFNEVIELCFDTKPPYAKIKAKLAETLVSLGHTGADHFGIFNPAKQSSSKFNAVNKSHIEVGLPLANSTLAMFDLENKPIFVKKMSNVPKKSVASQTDESFIATLRKFL